MDKALTDPSIIHQIDANSVQEIINNRNNEDKVDLSQLESNCFLENFYWNFIKTRDTNTWDEIVLFTLLVNRKFTRGFTYSFFDDLLEDQQSKEKFSKLFDFLLSTYQDCENITDCTTVVIFLTHCYESLYNNVVRDNCLKAVSLPLYFALSPNRLKMELSRDKRLAKSWTRLQSKAQDESIKPAKTFLPTLIKQFLGTISNQTDDDPLTNEYTVRVMEFLATLLSQSATRKFLRVLLDDQHLLTHLDDFSNEPYKALIQQLMSYQVDERTGHSSDIMDLHSIKLHSLQRVAFQHFTQPLEQLSMANMKSLSTRSNLETWFNKLELYQLTDLCKKLDLLHDDTTHSSKPFLIKLLVATYAKPDQHAPDSTLPTQTHLWNNVPTTYDGKSYPLWKNTLQYVCMQDYLTRVYQHDRMEQLSQLRRRIENVIISLNPRVNPATNVTKFTNTHVDAMPCNDFKMLHMSDLRMGELVPSSVQAQYTVEGIWESCQVALVTVNTSLRVNQQPDLKLPFCERYGVETIRIARVVRTQDESGTLTTLKNDMMDFEISDTNRKLILELDPHQFILDGSEIYESVNLCIKIPNEWILPPSANLFSAPSWLRDVYLGFGQEMGEPDDSQQDVEMTIPSDANANLNQHLTSSQLQIISECCGKNGLHVIKGLPGTGKSTLVCEIAHLLLDRVLIIVPDDDDCLESILKIFDHSHDDDVVCLPISEEDRQSDLISNYTAHGRLQFKLQDRLDLLQKVNQLANEMKASQYVGVGCEGAQYFYTSFIKNRSNGQPEILQLFEKLSKYRPYEMIRTDKDRQTLVLQQSRIVIATCSRARRLTTLEMNQFGTIIVDNADGVGQRDTLFPDKVNRVILIGDEKSHSLFTNSTLSHFCHADHTLFHRACQLQLSRNVHELTDSTIEENANQHFPGFKYHSQCVHVESYLGTENLKVGQDAINIGEAEYLVAVYMYMRLTGYRSDQICILSPNASQCELIRQIINRRCVGVTFEMDASPRVKCLYQATSFEYGLVSLVDSYHQLGHVNKVLTRRCKGLFVFCNVNRYVNLPQLNKLWRSVFSNGDTLLQLSDGPISDVKEMGNKVHGMLVGNN
ncbi:intron-binding protein aquarius [Acrasis kona]|uniref:Intron-binding protein aquarius n=1 Tax=Acrasis kona TaxID=1008807 RepID=A0AAW2YND3_9EUKA